MREVVFPWKGKGVFTCPVGEANPQQVPFRAGVWRGGWVGGWVDGWRRRRGFECVAVCCRRIERRRKERDTYNHSWIGGWDVPMDCQIFIHLGMSSSYRPGGRWVGRRQTRRRRDWGARTRPVASRSGERWERRRREEEEE